jgi:hypothetical protein
LIGEKPWICCARARRNMMTRMLRVVGCMMWSSEGCLVYG